MLYSAPVILNAIMKKTYGALLKIYKDVFWAKANYAMVSKENSIQVHFKNKILFRIA